MATELKQLLRVGQVAIRLGLSPTRINQMRAAGRIRGVQTSLGFLFEESEVARVENERRTQASRRSENVDLP